ncbi:MAG: septum formation inhibitor Maf [Gammaproteobacteria bacterium]|nr:septum formation inhibitor Maf [Gammaproteobacteria bacterium]
MPTPPVVLASSSPRRAELLAQIGVSFRTVVPEVPEEVLPLESPEAYVRRLAEDKAVAGLALTEAPAVVVGSDTTVVLDDTILGKPRHRADALDMLARLSGRSHRVMSAVAVTDHHGRCHSRVSISEVGFRSLSVAECEAYWETGEPVDKAGAYAIQGLAAVFVERLAGSYSGVMGLPLYETAQLLQDFGVPILDP